MRRHGDQVIILAVGRPGARLHWPGAGSATGYECPVGLADGRPRCSPPGSRPLGCRRNAGFVATAEARVPLGEHSTGFADDRSHWLPGS
jgi:hypothetical protein